MKRAVAVVITLSALSLASCWRCPKAPMVHVYAALVAAHPYPKEALLNFVSDSGQLITLAVQPQETGKYKLPASEEDCPTYAEQIETQIDDDFHVVSYLLSMHHDVVAFQIIGEPGTRISYKLDCATCYNASQYSDSLVVNGQTHYSVFEKNSASFKFYYSHFTGLIYFKYGNGPGWYRQF